MIRNQHILLALCMLVSQCRLLRCCCNKWFQILVLYDSKVLLLTYIESPLQVGFSFAQGFSMKKQLVCGTCQSFRPGKRVMRGQHMAPYAMLGRGTCHFHSDFFGQNKSYCQNYCPWVRSMILIEKGHRKDIRHSEKIIQSITGPLTALGFS